MGPEMKIKSQTFIFTIPYKDFLMILRKTHIWLDQYKRNNIILSNKKSSIIYVRWKLNWGHHDDFKCIKKCSQNYILFTCSTNKTSNIIRLKVSGPIVYRSAFSFFNYTRYIKDIRRFPLYRCKWKMFLKIKANKRDGWKTK